MRYPEVKLFLSLEVGGQAGVRVKGWLFLF